MILHSTWLRSVIGKPDGKAIAAGRDSQRRLLKPLWAYGFLVGQVGLEPTTFGLKVRCSDQLSYWPATLSFVAGVAGFEPAIADPKSAALPLGDTPSHSAGIGTGTAEGLGVTDGIRTHGLQGHSLAL